MTSLVVGVDQSRLCGRRTVGKARREKDKEEEPATEKREKYIDVGSDLEERVEHAEKMVG